MIFDWLWKNNPFFSPKEEEIPNKDHRFLFRPQKDITAIELAYITGSSVYTKPSLFSAFTIVPENQAIFGPKLMRHFRKIDIDTPVSYTELYFEMKDNLKDG